MNNFTDEQFCKCPITTFEDDTEYFKKHGEDRSICIMCLKPLKQEYTIRKIRREDGTPY